MYGDPIYNPRDVKNIVGTQGKWNLRESTFSLKKANLSQAFLFNSTSEFHDVSD